MNLPIWSWKRSFPRTARIVFACLLFGTGILAPVALHAQNTLIPLTTRRGMAFDHAGQHLYISTSDGFVQVYNLSTNRLETPYNLGGSLNGIDIARDDSFLLIAQGQMTGSQGTFHKLYLGLGIVTNINYTRSDISEGGAWDVAIGSNGLALVTTRFNGSGWVPLRQIDLITNQITVRADAPGSDYGMVRQDTQIHRSADGTRLYLLESNISSGPLFTYSATTNTFGPSILTWAFLDYAGAAVNRDGTLLGTRLGFGGTSLDTAADLNFLYSFTEPDSGVAFDGQTDTFYAISSTADQIIGYDTGTFGEKFRLDIGEAVNPWAVRFGTGSLIASDDGRYLALETPSGVRLFAVPTGAPSPTPTPAFGTPRDMVFDHAGQHLYITTAEGLVWPYNLSTKKLERPYDLGGSLNGVDIAPDDSFLLVAQGYFGIAQGAFYKLDLRSGAVTSLNYTKAFSFSEGGAWDVGIGSNGLALATTQYNGGGWTPLRQINLATNAIDVRTDAPGTGHDGTLAAPTQIKRSADRTRFYLLEEGIFPGSFFTYSATSDTFGPSAQRESALWISSAAVNRNGSLLGTRLYRSNASLETAPDFNHVQTFPGLDSGIAFDAVKDTFYGINSSTSQIIAYNTNNFAEQFRFDVGEDVSAGSTQFGLGLLVSSQDGRYLALIAPTAVRVYGVPAVQLVSVASVKRHGNVGVFSIDLPLNGPRGVECRSGGPNGEYTMIFTFGLNLTSVGGATITAGTGTATSSAVDSSNPHRYIVNLSGVTNAQYIRVAVTNVIDVAGHHTDSISQVMGVLVGDTNADGFVDAVDVSQTKSQSGNAVSNSNFREDVNVDGFVDAVDTAFIKSKSGTALSSTSPSTATASPTPTSVSKSKPRKPARP